MKFADDQIAEYPVAANTTIREGEVVIINASGYAVGGTAGTEQRIVGVSTQHVSNAGGTDGAKRVTVCKRGVVPCTAAATFAQSTVGAPAYLDGYDATNTRPTVHPTSTGRTQLGTVVGFEGDAVLVRLTTV